jgi:hypothetical protein
VFDLSGGYKGQFVQRLPKEYAGLQHLLQLPFLIHPVQDSQTVRRASSMMMALVSMLIHLGSTFASQPCHNSVSRMTETEDHGTRGTMTDDAAVCIDNREDGIDFLRSAEDDGMDDSIKRSWDFATGCV